MSMIHDEDATRLAQQEEPLRYRGVEACYRDTGLPCYQGNPLIEALPPIYGEEDVMRLLTYDPGYDEHYRQWAPEHRLHLLLHALQFIQPLSNHVGLEQLFSTMIRSGYVGRNPATTASFHIHNQQRLQLIKEGVAVPPPPSTAARGCSIVGLSGVGKSTAVNMILSLYDQVINHRSYYEQRMTLRQVVWMKLECPHDGLLSGLCKHFFQEIDRLLETNTYHHYVRSGRRSIDELLIDMAGVVARHCIGVLVIDEIQNLREARGESAAHLLNFLVQLDNQLGIPVVLVGTPKALPVLTGEFRRARRASGQGAFPWDRMQEDEEWQLFTNALWKYQYIRNPTPLTSELRHALYDESQGITDLAVKVYMLTQIEAITSEVEIVTKELLASVAQSRLRFVQRFIRALRAKEMNAEELRKYEDITPLDLEALVRGAMTIVSKRQKTASTQPLTDETRTISQEGTNAPGGNGPVDGTATPQKQRKTRASKKGADTTESLLELVKVVAKGKQRGMAAYESLQQAGHIIAVGECFLVENAPHLKSAAVEKDDTEAKPLC